jgi:hypothetical protein
MAQLVGNDAGELLHGQSGDQWQADRQDEVAAEDYPGDAAESGRGVGAGVHRDPLRLRRPRRPRHSRHQGEEERLLAEFERS